MTFPAGSASSLPWRLGPIRALACPCSSAMCQRLHHRVSEDLSRRRFLGGMAAMLAPFALPGTAAAWFLYRSAAHATRLPLHLTTDRALTVFVLTLVTCALSGFLALRKVRRLDPAEVF